MKRIAISGSNGKSTTALWTAAAIDGDDTTAACIWSGGNLFHGRPAQVEKTMTGFLRFDASIEGAGAAALVTEVTSRALEWGFADRWLCDVAVLTNVTHEHHDDHGSQSAYLKAKARLFDALRPGGIAVFTATDERAAQLMENARADIVRRGYPLTGRESFAPASVSAGIEEMSWERTQLAVESQDHRFSRISLTTPAPGDHFAENALAAWIAAISAGFDPAQAAAGIASASLPSGRFDIVGRAPTVVVDYGHCADRLHRVPLFFLWQEQKQVEQLIGGPGGVYICDSCVELCTEIIREEREARRTVPPAEPHA